MLRAFRHFRPAAAGRRLFMDYREFRESIKQKVRPERYAPRQWHETRPSNLGAIRRLGWLRFCPQLYPQAAYPVEGNFA